MADTFGQLWRELRLHCSFVPVPLAQHWVRDRYRKLLSRTLWAGSVSESEFIIPDAYSTGTISVNTFSTTATGVGTAFTAGMVGRQLLVGNVGPYYTITAVPDAVTLTLDRVFGGASATGQLFTIVQAYLTPPSDFLSLKVVVDPVNNWKLRINVPQEFIDTIDAQRTYAGTPRAIVDYRFSPTGIPMFEIWPRSLTQVRYPYLYYRDVADLTSDSDTPIFPIRGDVIKMGALGDLAKWPGTEDRRNPMFSLPLAAMYEKEFEMSAQEIDVTDQEIYQTMVTFPETGFDTYPYAPIDAAYLQVHDL